MGLDGIRCVNCGAKMKLVNVTRINTFRAPEARQYDVSVSFRKAGSGINQSSSREYLCTCCGYRLPAGAAKMVKEAKKAEEKVEKEVEKAVEKKSGKKAGKVNVALIIKLVIFLAIVAAAAFLAYKYRDTIMVYWEKLKELPDKAMGLIEKAKGFIENIKSKF